MSAREKRADSRAKQRVLVRFRPADGGKSAVGISSDVSVNGLFVSTATLHPRGTRLLISLPGGAEEQLVEVCHSRRHDPLLGNNGGMGLRRLVPIPGKGASFRIEFKNAAAFLAALQRDLREGRAFVAGTHVETGAKVRIEIVLPISSARPVLVDAIVTRVEPGGFHVEFDPAPFRA